MNTVAPTTAASTWFYMDPNNQQAGPAGEELLQQLIHSGAIQPDTLIWTDGMATWMKARETAVARLFPGSSPVSADYSGKETMYAYLDGANIPSPAVPESEFARLVQTHGVGANTLVWAEGMSDWTPLSATPLRRFLASPVPMPARMPQTKAAPQKGKAQPGMTQAEAEEHIGRAMKYGLFSLALTALIALLGNAFLWVDVVILGGLLFGVYKISRVCGVILVVYATISAIAILAERGLANPITWLVKALFIYVYFMGMRATFEWHKWK